MFNPETVNDILDEDGDDDFDESDDLNPSRLEEDPSMLNADGDLHDLKDHDQVNDLIESLREQRFKLMRGELKTYEGRRTDWGGGGRSRLTYDQARADMASDYHSKKHNMSWQEQHQEAMRTVRIANKLDQYR